LDQERSPWGKVTQEEGVKALHEALDIPQYDSSSPGATSSVDAALVFMQRLYCLAALIGDLKDFFEGLGSGLRGVTYEVRAALGKILEAVTSLNEDLLAVMDDPESDSLSSWVQQWGLWGAEAAGQRLDAEMAAMPLRPDSALSGSECQARHAKLVLLKGVVALLDDKQIRASIVSLGLNTSEAQNALLQPAAVVMQDDDLEVLSLSMPPSPAASRTNSPRSGYLPRQRETSGFLAEDRPLTASSSSAPGRKVFSAMEAALGAPVPPPIRPSPRVCRSESSGALSTAAAAATSSPPQASPKRSPSMSRIGTPIAPAAPSEKPLESPHWAQQSWPATPSSAAGEPPARTPFSPSWLQPPWPRPEGPLGPWTRPDTPSTVCDDADLITMPKGKFVDGLYVPRRPGSSGQRLPPLKVPVPRRAW